MALAAPLRARFEVELSRLRKLAPDARWVKPDCLHLTLAFLGEIADAQVPTLSEALSGVAARHPAFSLYAAGGGTFGAMAHPKVLWVGLGGDVQRLRVLQADVSRAVLTLGHEGEGEPYEPHVTLARSKQPKGLAALARCADALRGVELGQWPVRELSLFLSQATANGMTYTPLSTHALA